jgi:hypothetical protein
VFADCLLATGKLRGCLQLPSMPGVQGMKQDRELRELWAVWGPLFRDTMAELREYETPAEVSGFSGCRHTRVTLMHVRRRAF